MALSGFEIKSQINQFINAEIDECQNSVDHAANLVANIITNASEKSLKVKINKQKEWQRKKWFDKGLYEQKRELLYFSKMFQKYPNKPEIRRCFFLNLKIYNKARKHKMRQFQDRTLQQLDELCENQPQAYWKLLNSLKESKKTNCGISL